jgi:Bardet-Biedl syndrome 2 protein
MELAALNRDLAAQYAVRCSNHTELLACLKTVNHHIQRAARLRSGQCARDVVAQCRTCIKNNDVPGLVRVLTKGAAAPPRV